MTMTPEQEKKWAIIAKGNNPEAQQETGGRVKERGFPCEKKHFIFLLVLRY